MRRKIIKRDPYQCDGMVAVDSWKLANRIARRRRRSGDHHRRRQVPFKCEICGKWHIAEDNDDQL